MPILDKDWPLRVNDHVVLDDEYDIATNHYLDVRMIIPTGSQGMVRKVGEFGGAEIDFGHIKLRMTYQSVRNNLTLYRKAEAK